MKIFPELIWRLKGQQREDDDSIYLTFDDGPTPGVTTWVLDQLREYDAKGTFFCLGKNVEKHPDLYRQIIDEGHSVGNHTYSHLKGWQTNNTEYYNDIQLANDLMSSTLFRPPYGSIKTSQIKNISEEFNIVMWDVLSQDYSQTIAPQKVLTNVLDSVKGGSIVVFHDSLKAQPNLNYVLPRMLKELHTKYEFRKIV
jgi:peptidoglycan/xylan/chitin deacetylase (PgdA/CDA1 family)